jgi:hypothetical protein
MDLVSALDLLEAAYAVDADDETWFAELAARAGPVFDCGFGIEAIRIDLGSAEPVSDPRIVGGTDEWQRVWRENWWEPFLKAFGPEQLRFAVGFGTVFYSTHLWHAGAQHIPTYAELFARLGASGWGDTFGRYAEIPKDGRLFYPDSLNVLAVDPSHRGVAFFSHLREPSTGPVPAGTAAVLSRISGHITAALRLRARVSRADAAPPEAIVGASGRIEHAEGAARSRAAMGALRDAARNIDRARTRRVRRTPEALDLWRALHAGRWSLIDTFERDGRRYYVARANEPAPHRRPSLDGLSERERQVVSLLCCRSPFLVIPRSLHLG